MLSKAPACCCATTSVCTASQALVMLQSHAVVNSPGLHSQLLGCNAVRRHLPPLQTPTIVHQRHAVGQQCTPTGKNVTRKQHQLAATALSLVSLMCIICWMEKSDITLLAKALASGRCCIPCDPPTPLHMHPCQHADLLTADACTQQMEAAAHTR